MLDFAQFRACIFDFDGVLVDSEPVHAEAKALTLEQYQLQCPPGSVQAFVGRPDSAYFEWLAEQMTLPVSIATLLEEKHRFYQALWDEVALIDGSLHTVRALRQRYGKLGLVTSSTRHDVDLIAGKYLLRPWFDVIVTRDDCTQHKPDPAPYLQALSQLQLPGQQVLVIEDTPNGVKAAKGAGCQVLGLTTSFGAEVLVQAGADACLENYQQLQTWLAA